MSAALAILRTLARLPIVRQIVAGLAAYLAGRKAQADRERGKDLEEYTETRKRMDEVERPSDADAARDWLRNRNR